MMINALDRNSDPVTADSARWRKIARVAYWLLTGFIAVTMIFAGGAYLTGHGPTVAGFARVEFPMYAMQILGVFKIAGGLALLFAPWRTLKEWAYAGYVFNLIGAIAAHAFTDQAYGPAAMVLVMTLISYGQWKKRWM